MMTLKQIVGALIGSLAAEIEAAGKSEDYCSVTVMPGSDVPVDFGPESGCKGSAWVRVITATPTMSFPTADVGVNNCHYTLAYPIEIGMAGPAPAMEDRLGNFVLPEDTEQFDAAMRMIDEMDLMYRAIRGAGIPQLIVGEWTPSGPAGGILQSTWTLTAGGDDDD